MAISINTRDYLKTKDVEIDGVALKLRPMTSAESLRTSELGNEAKGPEANQQEILHEMLEIQYGLYSDPKKAEELLGKLPPEAVVDIYKKVMVGD